MFEYPANKKLFAHPTQTVSKDAAEFEHIQITIEIIKDLMMLFKRDLVVWAAIFFLIIFLLDLFIAESLDTNIVVGRRNQGFAVDYMVPYTGGGTSKCYPLTFSRLKPGQRVILKRSLFIDVCIVMPRKGAQLMKNFMNIGLIVTPSLINSRKVCK